MITLQRIHAKNFRSLGDITMDFDPSLPIVAITGPNGSGKTSVIAALLWAMYGLTPDGVNVKEMRRQGSEGDNVVAEVTFTHQQQVITITRSLVGSQSRTTAAISVDGLPITTVQSRTATQWIENRLGLDANGFLSAVVVRQKELDSLITMAPRERRARIEHLAGIDALDEAVTAARSEALQARRAAEAFPDPTADLATAQRALTEATTTLDQAHAHHRDTQRDATDAHAAFLAIDADAQAVAATLNTAKALNEELSTLNSSIGQLEGRISALTSERDRITSEIATATQQAIDNADTEATAAGQTLTALAARRDELNRIIADHRAASHHAATLTATAEKSHVTATTLSQTAAAARAHADTLSLPDLTTAVTNAAAVAQQAAEHVGAARGEWSRLTQAITTLQNAGHTPACPTCQQSVTDMATLIDGLTADAAAAQSRGHDWSARQRAADTAETQARSALATAEAAHAAAQHAEERAAAARDTATTDASAAAAATVAVTATAAAATDATSELANVAAQVTHWQDARDTAVTNAADLRRIAQQAVRRDELAATITTLTADLTRQTSQRDTLSASITALNIPTDTEQERIRQQWQDANVADKTAAAAQDAAAAAIATATTTIATTTTTMERLTAHARQRSALFRAAEDATHTKDSLDDFRKDRLARLAPELAEISAELVAAVTAGRYTDLTLDEDFTPTVTDADGTTRNVALLSGGEQSVVAFALRVAVGEILSGGTGGLLVLDEVLTAQDDSRRDAMISAIRNLPNRQVITINHVAESTDISDIVYKIEGKPANVSILTRSADETPLNLIDA